MEQALASAQLESERGHDVADHNGHAAGVLGSDGAEGDSPALVVAKVDGRRARGARTREAIVTALLELIAEGDVAPTAQRIADRAGVSVRSVYQHFADVEGLYTDASAKTLEWLQGASAQIDPQLPLGRKIDLYAANRAMTLETLSTFMRASRLVEPTSAVMRENRAAMLRWERTRVKAIFAEQLEQLDTAAGSTLLAAIDTLGSAEAWDHLRISGHSARSARQVLRSGVAALLAASSA